MSGLLPKSLVGRMAVLIGIALFLATLAGMAFALVERQQFNRAEVDTPAVTRFTSTAADFVQTSRDFQPLVLSDASRRGAHYELAGSPSIAPGLARRDDTEDRLQQSLAGAGVRAIDVRAALDPHPAAQSAAQGRRRGANLLVSVQLPDKRWINARLSTPLPPPLITPELLVGTLLAYLFVLSASVLIAIRLARPLKELTNAAEAFRGRNEPVVVQPSGPTDLRNAILAFNAMNERVVSLLEEKDRTLGAIGHDLRTPLASLRIRAENVEPEEDRERMVATIEEMTKTLEAILTLARLGRSREQLEPTDVSEAAESLADEYRELGEAVTFSSDGPLILDAQPILLRRAIRNLVDNALNYAGAADIVVSRSEGATISVMDRGPGLDPSEIPLVTTAFYRAEPSRNRETGGAGLGLSIAKAVAEAHGGSLTLVNREGGGLTAKIRLPVG